MVKESRMVITEKSGIRTIVGEVHLLLICPDLVSAERIEQIFQSSKYAYSFVDFELGSAIVSFFGCCSFNDFFFSMLFF